MKQVLCIHGGEAFSKYDDFLNYLQKTPVQLPNDEVRHKWRTALPADLGPDYEVFLPEMPNKLNAKYVEWKLWFERYFEHLHNGVVLVGYSLGGYFLSKYLVEQATPFAVQKLILIAPLFSNQVTQADGEDGGDFAFNTENVPILATRAEEVVLMHSRDDFVVPFSESEQYVKSVPGARLVVFTDRNHFLQPHFPELVDEIRSAWATE